MTKLTPPKKLAMISDMTGFGRCSMTVAMPVISALSVQACPAPTSIFSNHTAFETYHFDDYSDRLPDYLNAWAQLKLQFDGIYSSFLGSDTQIQIVEQLIRLQPDALVLVDPVMGDHGKAYKTITPQLCTSMKQLVHHADIITPNLTEACLLTDTNYAQFLSDAMLSTISKPAEQTTLSAAHEQLLAKLAALGPAQIVVTGIQHEQMLRNLIWDHGKISYYDAPIRWESRPGTGDIFAAILAACAVRGISLKRSVQIAADFIGKCTNASHEAGIPVKEGVCYEYFLSDLCQI